MQTHNALNGRACHVDQQHGGGRHRIRLGQSVWQATHVAAASACTCHRYLHVRNGRHCSVQTCTHVQGAGFPQADTLSDKQRRKAEKRAAKQQQQEVTPAAAEADPQVNNKVARKAARREKRAAKQAVAAGDAQQATVLAGGPDAAPTVAATVTGPAAAPEAADLPIAAAVPAADANAGAGSAAVTTQGAPVSRPDQDSGEREQRKRAKQEKKARKAAKRRRDGTHATSEPGGLLVEEPDEGHAAAQAAGAQAVLEQAAAGAALAQANAALPRKKADEEYGVAAASADADEEQARQEKKKRKKEKKAKLAAEQADRAQAASPGPAPGAMPAAAAQPPAEVAAALAQAGTKKKEKHKKRSQKGDVAPDGKVPLEVHNGAAGNPGASNGVTHADDDALVKLTVHAQAAEPGTSGQAANGAAEAAASSKDLDANVATKGTLRLELLRRCNVASIDSLACCTLLHLTIQGGLLTLYSQFFRQSVSQEFPCAVLQRSASATCPDHRSAMPSAHNSLRTATRLQGKRGRRRGGG